MDEPTHIDNDIDNDSETVSATAPDSEPVVQFWATPDELRRHRRRLRAQRWWRGLDGTS